MRITGFWGQYRGPPNLGKLPHHLNRVHRTVYFDTDCQNIAFHGYCRASTVEGLRLRAYKALTCTCAGRAGAEAVSKAGICHRMMMVCQSF